MDSINEKDREKILETLKQFQNQMGGHQSHIKGSSLSETIALDNAKLIECRHEIVISVLATVMEEDNEGKIIGTKQIAKQNYHIPVPSNQDHEEYLKGFFSFFEKCMSTSAEKMEPEPKEDTNNG